VMSSAPAFVADAAGCNWQGMYMRDEWGAIIYEWVKQKRDFDIIDHETSQRRIKTETIRQLLPKLNPEYDTSRTYVPRSERNEWAAVGLMGQLIARDDGSCRVNGYCLPNDCGVATSCAHGYRVLERIDAKKVLICLK